MDISIFLRNNFLHSRGYQLPKTPLNWSQLNLTIDFSQQGSYAVLAKWLKTPVFDIVVIQQSWVQILSRTSTLTKQQMI